MRVSFKNVTRKFGSTVAVDNVSFDIGEGEIIGLVGPNGAGKTTTMRLLCGIIMPDSGLITYDGKPQKEVLTEARSRIGFLPENNPLPDDMFVSEYLEYECSLRGLKEPEKRIKKVAAQVGIADYLLKPIGVLSKGYRQRTGLAAALLPDPELLVLDEPQEGLDPNQRAETRKLIKEIGRERTVILSTHVLAEVAETCSRLLIIDRGRIIRDGSVEETMREFAGHAVVLEIEGQNVVEELKQQFPDARIEKAGERGQNVRVRLFHDRDIRAEIFRFCAENNLVILEMYEEKTSLEDVFRKLTGVRP